MAEETPQTEGTDIKKRALVRLGVAALVTAAALGGLWWLDKSGKEAIKQPPSPPSPIITAAPPSVSPPPIEEVPAEPLPTAPAQVAAAPEEPAVPPPPVVGSVPSPPAKRPARETQPAPAAAKAPTTTAPAAAKPSPPDRGYILQLGVFSNPDNAKELVAKLHKQGIRAHTETRVQMGPFENRQEAEKAQAELQKLGYKAVVTTANGATK